MLYFHQTPGSYILTSLCPKLPPPLSEKGLQSGHQSPGHTCTKGCFTLMGAAFCVPGSHT